MRAGIVQRVVPLVAGVAAALPQRVWAQGCAMCRTAVEGGDEALALGFNWSILLLIGVTYGLLATVGGWIAFRYWKGQPHARAAEVVPFAVPGKEPGQ
jgi:hypothetical protein